VFGTRFDVSDNPAPHAPWAQDEDGHPVTFADWARTEARFAPHFAPLAESDAEPLALDEYLRLAPEKRAAVTPFVTAPGPDGEAIRLRVSPEMAATAEERLGTWRTLLEVAGVLTPFTDGVRLQVERAVAAEHEEALAALRRDYEQQLREAGASARQELAGRLRESLLSLAGHGTRPPGNGGGS
jgi:pyruvate-ferredoxin/flavodoxin oxidoreductase